MKWLFRLPLYVLGFTVGIVLGNAVGVTVSLVIAAILLLSAAAVMYSDQRATPFRRSLPKTRPTSQSPLAERYIRGEISLEEFERQLAASEPTGDDSSPQSVDDEPIPVVGDWPFRGEGYFIQLTTTDYGGIHARVYLCHNGEFYTPQQTLWPNGHTVDPGNLDAAIADMKRFIRGEQTKARELQHKKQQALDAVKRYTSKATHPNPETPQKPDAEFYVKHKPRTTPRRAEGIKSQPTRVPNKDQ